MRQRRLHDRVTTTAPPPRIGRTVRTSGQWSLWLLRLSAVVSSATVRSLAMTKGHHHAPYFSFLIAVPLCIVVVLQDEVGAAVASVVTTFLGATTILHFAHVSGPSLLQWLNPLLGSSVVAVYSSIHIRAQLNEESLQMAMASDDADAIQGGLLT